MARKSKKDVYGRIEDQQNLIMQKEEELKKLNDELQVLFSEKDDLEMHQLLAQMKSNNLDIETALAQLNLKPKK